MKRYWRLCLVSLYNCSPEVISNRTDPNRVPLSLFAIGSQSMSLLGYQGSLVRFILIDFEIAETLSGPELKAFSA